MLSASSAFLASFPSPDRGVWHLGPIPIRAYALCIIVGIVVAIWWGERRLQARGGAPGTVIDVAVWAVPFGLVGGRLYHVATDYHLYFGAGKNPLNALRIWDGGLGIWGAIALGAVGALIGCRSRGIPLPAFADAVAPGIAAAQAIGRIGNYFNQELFGRTTDLPWGLEIYRRVNEAGDADTLSGVAESHIPIDVVHPTFLYELLWNLGVAALVVWADRRFRLGHGRAFAVYVAGYTAGRTWIELMRVDSATHVFGVRINVWVSILVFIGAVFYLVWAKRLGPREDLAALTADQLGAEETAEPPTEEAADEAAVTSDEEPAQDADQPAAEETDKPARDAEPTKPADADAVNGQPTGNEPADADAVIDQPAGDREQAAAEPTGPQPINAAAGHGGPADQPSKDQS